MLGTKGLKSKRTLKRLLIDSIMATILIVGIEQALYYVYYNFKLFDILEPIEKIFIQSSNDYELNDYVFARLKEPKPIDDRITLVNIGLLPRDGIAELLNIVNKHQPAVVGVDTFFKVEKDSIRDAKLEEAFKNTQNLVLVNKLANYNPETDSFDSLEVSISKFARHAQLGFSNLIAPEAKSQNDLEKTRAIALQEYANDTLYKAFGVKLVELFEPKKAEKSLARNNEVEIINYSGNILDTTERLSTRFRAIDIEDIFLERFDSSFIQAKIIILGYLGYSIGDELSTEDKYLTPLYEKYDEKGEPNMYGTVIHANIVSMILDEDYINSPSNALMNAINVIILFINVLVFSYFYHLIPQWYHGTTKLIQVIEIIALMYVMIYSFHYFNYDLQLGTAIFYVALVGDSLEVY